MQILAINPGSTSTKIAVFKNKDCLLKETIEHPSSEINTFSNVVDQYQYRLDVIITKLKDKEYKPEQFDAVVGRGGLLKPLIGGTYTVDKNLVEELKDPPGGEHASNLGGILAYKLGQKVGIPAYIVDPVSVDEMDEVARISGHPELPRVSLSHALNKKAVCRKAANSLNKNYNEVNFITAHMGSGITVGAHRQGKLIDVTNALNEGAFTPERCGGLPIYQLVKLCYSGKYTEKEMLTGIIKRGGLYAYLGTKDVRKVEERINKGDKEAELVLKAMCYQVAKEIGSMSTALYGKVDRIILTGGLAYSKFVSDEIISHVSFIAPIIVIPGEQEMESLAMGALRVLNGEEKALTY
ncbi:MAG: butyrate kinase [Firmicutes bacterium]|nr:butyrate kinase [Bacillota bacterium]